MRWFILLLPILLFGIPAEAIAQKKHNVDVPAGRLDKSLSILSRQTGANIGGVDPAIRRTKSRRVQGRLSTAQALSRILQGTPFTYRRKGTRVYKIVRRKSAARRTVRRKPPKSKPERRKKTPSPPAPPPEPLKPPQPIIVTATKMDSLLASYAGTAHVFDMQDTPPGVSASGVETLSDALPSIAQTHFGTGRNKLFVRGIADSSFNGPTQSTLALYLNDTRLTYSAPNPDLRLYDTRKVEIIEGPQGSLYGAGAIGGILRTETEPADPSDVEGAVWLGSAYTAHGDGSFNIAAMVNTPIAQDAAIRVLAYHQDEGGYIDDTLRGLDDINSTTIDGGRLSAHWSPDNQWEFDLLASRQRLRAKDSQYTDADDGSLTRRSALAQPFGNDIDLYSFNVRRRLGDLQIVSATGYVRNSLTTRFDATPASPDAQLTVFDEVRDIQLFSHETRISASNRRLNWLAGLSYLRQKDQVQQFYGPATDPTSSAGTNTILNEYAAFGEASLMLDNRWTVRLGGRAVIGRVFAEQFLIDDLDIDPDDSRRRFLPSASVRWSPRPTDAIHLRYQRGYRIGGISISGGDTPTVTEFDPDRVDTVELGIKYALGDTDRLKLTHSFFFTKWQDVQADAIGPEGFPRTANIGDGNVYGVTLTANWRPIDSLSLKFSGFANESELTEIAEGITPGEDMRLPNISELGATGQMSLEQRLNDSKTLRFTASAKYVGHSILGLDQFLSLEQGDYVDLGGRIVLESDSWSAGLVIDNILNSTTSRFALGNPFQRANSLQLTPLRPITIGLNFHAEF